MAPAPVIREMQQDLQLQHLTRAFEGLLLTAHQLSCREKHLQKKLSYAHDQYLKLADRLPGGLDSHTKIISEKIIGRDAEFDKPREESLKPADVVKTIAESGNVGSQVLAAITDGLECYKSIPNSQEDSLLSGLNQCSVATRAGVPSLEKDFTTKGTRGSLRCPFAKPNNKPPENGVLNGIEDPFKAQNGDSCGHDEDPIKAELNDRRSCQTPSHSARSSNTRCPIARCPIRYLDQHTPEEVADYVERHKHEIPRSHAICVNRYQRDSQSMRQLDAKYGNLINMIQGLSVKHQVFLPGRGPNGEPSSNSSADRVERWAEDVGSKSLEGGMNGAIKEEEEDGEERKGHFDRPLREVRVGESPSRPWGIPVPAAMQAPISAPHSPVAQVPVDSDKSSTKPSDNVDASSVAQLRPPSPSPHGAPAPKGRCPFGRGAPKPENLEPETATIRNQDVRQLPADTSEQNPGEMPSASAHLDNSNPAAPATIVFNGPVFFGYSPEQTASFIQQLGSLGHKA
ncbi:hypothetical protein ASPWEDRAFT_42315 [Aspergillus wentii DTO 134E9]|uniref:Uncharacterized protein n=1 Tax=Aspergillus wentii DTO 134E9 TaxID=1073089 RepID=A0A1L9RHC9_ASPWE|nr:uncharacterized protein ASPWEDRAFT_42315 [Aspergillus wentii DTO 134E9]KAI9925677.1 hypothetical protein MW887_005476 [Aspergillus wentii]OJJ34341.1 hypothetical protein ASPWEDRAFT_42315 [Aspergillus wentii DTO 134E9]